MRIRLPLFFTDDQKDGLPPMRLIASAIVGLALLTGLATPARADGSIGFMPGAGDALVHVKTLSDERFTNVVRQRVDYSCGAAAVATILRYAYFIQTDEDGVVRGMLQVSDAKSVRERGFSLLDIKNYVQNLGMSGAGYQISLEKLYALNVPSIVLLTVDGYEHFVVLKKATPPDPYVADPALGNRAIPTSEFSAAWTGNIIFVIRAPLYDPRNPLESERGSSTNALADNILSPSDMLSNSLLMTILIPGPSRL